MIKEKSLDINEKHLLRLYVISILSLVIAIVALWNTIYLFSNLSR